MSRLLRRIAFYLLTAWAAVTINFLIPRLMPGDPVQAALERFQTQGTPLSPAAMKSLEVAFGVHEHQSLWAQYLSYWGDILHGNFGVSFAYFPTPVWTVIAQSLPWTLVLVGVSTVIAWVVGTGVGALAGWNRGGRWDAVVPVGALFRGIPQFWIGLLAITVLGVSLRVLPVAGGYAGTVTPSWSAGFIGSALVHALLPALTIVVGSFAGHLLMMRNMMVTTRSEDYVLVAEAKGLSRRRVMLGYAARNAMIPSVIGFALELGFVVSGALVVERVFSYPGLGFVLFQAIGAEDFPLMEGVFLIITLAVLAANVLADVVLVIVDPRAREGAGR